MATALPHSDLRKEDMPPQFTRAKSYSPERIVYDQPSSENPDDTLEAGQQGLESNPAKPILARQDTTKIEVSQSFPGSQVDTPLYAAPPSSAEKSRPTTGLQTRRSISVPTLDKESQQPTLQRADSEISTLAKTLESFTIQKRHSPPPMGKTKAVNTINARFSRFSSANPHMSQLPTRTASWTAGATSPDAKIDEAIRKIMCFINDVLPTHKMTVDHEFREAKMKEFLDASKEIVRTWRGHHNELFQGRAGEVLRARVDEMDVIIAKWTYETHEDWLMNDAGILMHRSVSFGKEWEALTKNDLGATAYWKNHPVNQTSSGESFEKMEYIQPKTVVEKNNEEGAEHNNDSWSESTMGSPEKSFTTTPAIEKSHQRNSSAPLRFLTRSHTLPSVEEKPETSALKSSHTTPLELTKVNERFDKIEHLLSEVTNTIVKSSQSAVDEDTKVHKRLNDIDRTLKQVSYSAAHPVIPEDTQLHERLDTIEQSLKEVADRKLTPTVSTEDKRSRERLDNIERILKQFPIQSLTEAANMQLLLLPEVHEALFGEWEKKSPDQKVEERAWAKKTGLLMMSKYFQEWKDKYNQEYGQKIAGLDCDVRSKKSTSLLNSVPRIEQSLASLTSLTTKLSTDLNTISQHKEPTPLPTPAITITEPEARLPSETTTITAALDKLSTLLHLATSHNIQELLRQENEKLKGEIGGLKKGLEAAIFTLAEKEGKEKDKSWIEEAWEEVYEGFWPQGEPLQEELEGRRKIMVLPEDGVKGTDDMVKIEESPEEEKKDVLDNTGGISLTRVEESPELLEIPDEMLKTMTTNPSQVGNQAGRGGGGGTGTGSCMVM
ncbi:hypothetical protein HYFRA_00003105 [Hymenoscyphus fraxineus]|uniref:Uncharacterized protein n=1 Tax=Hymenoscyphus fraxineus TaxID=746836 RepID=A0A9N9PPR5_9HELO|nr:hypothetical protein HYFRA_00003105 [Hymenoscyphus fraxineus]